MNIKKPLGGHDYAVTINSGITTNHAVRTVKFDQLRRSFRVVTSTLLVLGVVGGGLFIGAVSTSETANANPLADATCTNAESGNDHGNWSDGLNKFSKLGGHVPGTSDEITSSDPIDKNFSVGQMFGGTDATDKELTALEKYGSIYPIFGVWTPAFTDDTFTYRGSGDTLDSRLNAGRSGEPLAVGDSKLVTNDVAACFGAFEKLKSEVANSIAYVPKVLLGLSLEAYDGSMGADLSDDTQIMGGLIAGFDDLVTKKGGLRDTLFLPFFLPLIMLGGVWVAWVALIKRQTTKGLQGVAFMIGAVALGTFFLQNPSGPIIWLSSVTSVTQSGISDAFAPLMGSNEMCEAKGERAAQRTVACNVWYSAVYQPWEQAQFGTTDGANEEFLISDPLGTLGNSTVDYGTRSVTPDTWSQFMLDRQATGLTLQQSEVAYAQLSGDGGNGINSAWAGGGNSQIGAALWMWVSVPAYAGVLLVFSIMLFIYKLMAIVLVVWAPFVCLVSIIPSNKGVALRWAELAVANFIKSVIITLLLCVFLWMTTNVGQYITQSVGQIVFVIAAALMILTIRGKLTGGADKAISFGGDKDIDLPGTKQAAKLASFGGGLLGLTVGGLVGGIKGSKMAKTAVEETTKGPTGQSETGDPTRDVKLPAKAPAAPSVTQGASAGAKVAEIVQSGSGGSTGVSSPAPASTTTAQSQGGAGSRPNFPKAPKPQGERSAADNANAAVDVAAVGTAVVATPAGAAVVKSVGSAAVQGGVMQADIAEKQARKLFG